MVTDDNLITSELARAARALAQVSPQIVSVRTGLDAELVRDFERGIAELDAEQNAALRAGLEGLGVDFLPVDDDEGLGAGVRQRFNPRTVKRMENWENEGGPAIGN